MPKNRSEFDRLGQSAGGADAVHPLHHRGKRRNLVGAALAQLPRQRVLRVLGPGEPDFFHRKLLRVGPIAGSGEQVIGENEARDMVVVLMGHRQNIHLAVGRPDDIRDDRLKFGAGILGAEDHPAVDHEMKILLRRLQHRDQEAVAETLPVHANAQPGSAIAASPRRSVHSACEGPVISPRVALPLPCVPWRRFLTNRDAACRTARPCCRASPSHTGCCSRRAPVRTGAFVPVLACC